MKAKKQSRLLKLFLITCSTVLVSACASTNIGSISEADGRVQLADAHMGQDYDAVISNAQARYKVEPHCEARKVALSKQRKAFSYDTCAFTPENALYADAPLSEVVYHFIGGALVRVDLRAQGEGDLLLKVKGDLDGFFTPRGATAEQLGQASYEWAAANEIAGVRQGAGASSGNVLVRMFDRSLNDDAPWLTDD